MSKKFLRIIVALLLSVPTVVCALGVAGDLDVTFNAGGSQPGVLRTPLYRFADLPTLFFMQIAVQQDGALIVAGKKDDQWLVMRILADGLIDTTFGFFGATTIAGLSSSAELNSIVVQSDGKIVLVGNVSGQFVVVRLLSNGALDTGFGDGSSGIKTIAVGSNAVAYSVALQGDDKIVVAGYGAVGGNNEFAIVRLLTNGALDTGFGDGSSGIKTVAIGSNAVCYSVALQPDGKIVAAGYWRVGSNSEFAIVRLLTTGALDTGFGDSSSGIKTVAIGSNAVCNSVALQGDDKIVVAGYGEVEGNNDFAIVRLLTNGALDTGFGESLSGIATVAIGSLGLGNSVVVQSDGKIVVAGGALVDGPYEFAIVQLQANGLINPFFGNAGIKTVALGIASWGTSNILQPDGKIVVAGLADITSDVISSGVVTVIRLLAESTAPFDEAFSLAVQSDGRIILAGSTFDGVLTKFSAARVLENGDLDTTFNLTGTRTVEIGTESGARAVALQPNGKIVMAGYAVIDNVSQFALVKLWPDGRFDAGFGSNGIVTLPIGTEAVARAIGIQDDGKIVVAGYAVVGGVRQFALARFLPQGILDTAFGTDGIVLIAIGSDSLSRAVALQTDDKIVAAGYGYDSGNKFAVTRVWGKSFSSAPRMSLTSWLKTIYAEELGYVPGDTTVTT